MPLQCRPQCTQVPDTFILSTPVASTLTASSMHAAEQSAPWQAFIKAGQAASIRPERLNVLEAAGLSIDLTGQVSSPELTEARQALLKERGFDLWRDKLLSGQPVNNTEERGAWHTMLRAAAPIEAVAAERQRMNQFIRDADSERRWRNIVHIGIGGSDWGVRLTVSAFGYAGMWRQVRFAASIDGHAIEGALAGLDPHDTLIVLASKSFTTAESLQNARRAIEWQRDAGVADPYANLVVVTARPDLAVAWGARPAQIFRLWDWVGGRFSLWSSVGITTAMAVGSDVLAGMQAGAAAMDNHFANAPYEKNAPIQMAMAGIVNRNARGFGSLNIAPYDFRLSNLVAYLQQLEMESLGKSVDLGGEPVSVPTGPAVWGMAGTDAQHTFFQWLHQGSDGAPVDFIVCQEAGHRWPDHHCSLLANCLAQREALLRGKSYDAALQECLAANVPPEKASWLAKHRVHPGGRPSTLIVLPKLTPYTLGALVALYEHKVFVQGVVWGINPFDQWGVEYGKVLAKGITDELSGAAPATDATRDASTAYWVKRFSA